MSSHIKSKGTNTQNELKDQFKLLEWLYVNIDLPKRIYEIHDMLNIMDKLDFSMNDHENHQKVTIIESMLKQSGEAIAETLKMIAKRKADG